MDYQGPVHQVFRGRSGIVKAFINGREVFFLVTHFKDVIQREHRQGRFYEPEELEIIRKHVRPNETFCDIGCNVGNHTLFVGLFLQPRKIICFEPNADIIPTLKANIMLNNLERICDLQFLGYGLSDRDADGLHVQYGAKNTGAGRLMSGEGDVKVRSGDAMLAGEPVGFLKIDVEGMELEVLAGLKNTLAESKPTIFIEVENANIAHVTQTLAQQGYRQAEEWRRYPENINLLFVPEGP